VYVYCTIFMVSYLLVQFLCLCGLVFDDSSPQQKNQIDVIK
jgi:hypothetical protein